MLEFVSPLALNHGQHLLTAAAHVWSERRHKSLSLNAKSVSLLSTANCVLGIRSLPVTEKLEYY